MSDSRGIAVVTGATGFLGRPLCARLAKRGYLVRAAARTAVAGTWSEFVRIDLPSVVPYQLFDRVDVVFHLAGRAHSNADSRADASLYREINTRGTEAVARIAKEAGTKRFVLMSTVKVFGEPGAALVREDHLTAATDPYGRSKLEAEDAVLAMRSPGFEVVVLRPVLVYGPGAKGNLDSLIRLLRAGRMPPLPRIANRRSMIGVNDLIEAAALVGHHPGIDGRIYTVTDGVVYSTTDIIETLAAAQGITHPPAFRLPVGVLRAGAMVGDAGRRITGRRFPLDSNVMIRLLGNAEYEAKRLSQDTGFLPTQTLRDLAAAMVAADLQLSTLN